MQISVGSTITRQRPHVIVWVRKFAEWGLDADSVTAMLDTFDKGSTGGVAAKLSKRERIAILMLQTQIPKRSLTTFIEYATAKGVTKRSAFNLDTLTATMWPLGAVPRGWYTPKWKRLLATTEASIELVQRRCIGDNEMLPDNMQKPKTDAELDHLML